MNVQLKGLGVRTKRLSGGRVRYYITAWRTQPGEAGAPVIATADGATMEAARAAAQRKLADPDVIEQLAAARGERARRLAEASTPRLTSVRFIDGLVTRFIAFMESAADPETGDGPRRRRRKDIRGTSRDHKANVRRFLENFREHHGDWRVSLFERPEIIGDIVLWREQWMHQARNPDYAISAVSVLFAWARQQGYTKADPTRDVKSVYQSDRADIIWKPEHLAYARQHAPPAFWRYIRLAASIGMREAELIRLLDSAVGDVSIARMTRKRGRLAVVPLTAEARAVIEEMRAAKAGGKIIAATLATNESGRPWTKAALDSALRRLKAIAAEDPDAPEGFCDLHLHDLRGNACTAFRLAGFSAARIALIMGWSERRVETMLAIYCSTEDLARAMLAELALTPSTSTEQQQNLHTGLHTGRADH